MLGKAISRITAIALLLTASHAVAADDAADYPNHPVRLLAASAAGGNPDVMARLMSVRLSEGFPSDGGPMALAAPRSMCRRGARPRAEVAFARSSSGGAAACCCRASRRSAPSRRRRTGLLFEEAPEDSAFAPTAGGRSRDDAADGPGAADAGLGRRRCAARSPASISYGQFRFHEREAPLVAADPAQAFALAGDLAAPHRRHDHRGRALDAARSTSRPATSTPIGASRSTSSRSPSSNGRPGSRRTASSTGRRAARCWSRGRSRAWMPADLQRAARHRRLDRHQSRHRAADRRHRALAAGRGGAARSRPRRSTTPPGR